MMTHCDRLSKTNKDDMSSEQHVTLETSECKSNAKGNQDINNCQSPTHTIEFVVQQPLFESLRSYYVQSNTEWSPKGKHNY